MKKTTPLLFVITLLMATTSLVAQTKWTYISPVPGSKYANPEQIIAFRTGDIIAREGITPDIIDLEGSVSGKVSVNISFSKDGRTIYFNPNRPFNYGEKVHVTLQMGISTINGLVDQQPDFYFTVMERENTSLLAEYYLAEEGRDLTFVGEEHTTPSSERQGQSLITYGDYQLPDRFMNANITTLTDPTPGYTFLTPRGIFPAPYDPYNVILDQYGVPVFYQQWNTTCNLFQKTFNNDLVFCAFSNANPTLNKWYRMNDKFEMVDTLVMGNGYYPDQHGIALNENGNHLLIAYDPQPINMDTVFPGGNPNATVVGLIIQELDSDHNVLFQWRSWDHFDILDATHLDFTAAVIDYVHGNSVQYTLDNQILISCRGMDEVTKIDRNTGEVIWRFGNNAINNQFTFLNDTIGFSHQHDAQQISNGNYTLYDNGSFHANQISSGQEYVIDEVNMTAELVWKYEHNPSIFANATGSNHRLSEDHKLICWGLTWPIASTEVNENNEVVWELEYPDSVWNYQAFRQDWTTSLFTTSYDTVDFGYYDDYVPWPIIITLTNHSNDDITITSASNHLSVYTLITPLPLSIGAGEAKNVIINFFPEGYGPMDFNDVVTFNYDSYFSDTLSRRISRQVVLKGTTIEPLNDKQYLTRKVELYPNPTRDVIQIKAVDSDIIKVGLFNLSGQMLLEEDVLTGEKYAIDMSGLNSGVYFIKTWFRNTDNPEINRVIKN